MVRKRPIQKLPDIDLVPMLDVMMSVLTFFVIVTMTFSGKVIENVETPKATDIAANEIIEGPILIALNNKGEIVLDTEIISLDELREFTRRYLSQDANGEIIFKADRSLDYIQVRTVLETIAEEGGDRVSLAISQ